MDLAELAHQVAAAIGEARDCEDPASGVTVVARGSSAVRLDGACPHCSYRFSSQSLIVTHPVHGRRSISDRSVHYLSHGIANHDSGHVLDGKPVLVEIDLPGWARFLDLEVPTR